MRTYQTIRESKISNLIVKELNASVCPLTFESKEGVQKADLYYSINSGYTLVGHQTCAPIHTEFIKTVNILF